jgi:hypothetical protein
VGISRDYPLKTRISKQPIREIPRFKIIPSHLLKYPRSKQGLKLIGGELVMSGAPARHFISFTSAQHFSADRCESIYGRMDLVD